MSRNVSVHGPTTFTILHTNDLHSNLLGMSPSADYTPFTLNDDMTRGGYARPATLIAKEARKKQGTVLILDAGDSSMGTTFAAAIRETGCRFQLKPNVSSGAGSLAGTRTQPTPGLDIRSTYAASETALNALTVAMAIELEPEGIKVNAVSPGFIKTNLNNYGARELSRRASASRCASLCSDRMV